jgi:hypothetical protein
MGTNACCQRSRNTLSTFSHNQDKRFAVKQTNKNEKLKITKKRNFDGQWVTSTINNIKKRQELENIQGSGQISGFASQVELISNYIPVIYLKTKKRIIKRHFTK